MQEGCVCRSLSAHYFKEALPRLRPTAFIMDRT
jgi:hypothetical protein